MVCTYQHSHRVQADEVQSFVNGGEEQRVDEPSETGLPLPGQIAVSEKVKVNTVFILSQVSGIMITNTVASITGTTISCSKGYPKAM